jgi:hypothetical protein
MAATPNWHVCTKMSPTACLSSINYLKDCARVKYAIILRCEKGKIGRLGTQLRTPRTSSPAIGAVALSAIGHKVQMACVSVL